ncbi:Acetyl-/propionyl-coenzyme A carboxylase alpha chain [Cedecea neteri]|uniref:Biotin carboxylase n=1 Tax=Cedecea neteri TaxID=158822 RepID=A0A2X3JBV7_9ENTR|nr:Acetyl-/propionyl-coenzyme A carboxylase alpha chain [Cedecea neteri]
MFSKVLIANRGEIACRAIRTLKKMNITSVAVYSDADASAQHVIDADEAMALGGDKASDTYLNIEKILAAAQESGAEAIFPGYGFLSERAEFAEACETAGIVFIGPTAQQISDFGLKHRARELASGVDVPMTPGTGLLTSLAEARLAAAEIGYPVMLKTTAGGGGIGLTRCDSESALLEAWEKREAHGRAVFQRRWRVYRTLRRQSAPPGSANLLATGRARWWPWESVIARCSAATRRWLRKTPAPNLPQATREALHRAAVALGESVHYRSAGTVEFIYDAARDAFYFLEVNTRLQVEHPVTECVTGLDLIECMVLVAAEASPDWQKMNAAPQGAAIEVRIYAEDALKNFQPSPGVLTDVYFPEGVRVDGWVSTGSEVSAFYDPMIAKIIVHGEDRLQALSKLNDALAATRLHGIRHQSGLSAPDRSPAGI